jgi:phosphoglycolate phosphatase-like HAD superfamily hydrolase
MSARELGPESHARRAACLLLAAVLALIVLPWSGCRSTQAASDALPSWRDGRTKQAILEFVRLTTDPTSAKYVQPAERIATFDNDGTLWVEQPIYTQVQFAMDRLEGMAKAHPELKEQHPYRALLAHDPDAMRQLTAQDVEKIVAVTHSGMTVEAFLGEVRGWLATAKHPRFGRLYTELVYQPMLELLGYLRANGYRTYIVTGGGQDFVRAFSERIYGVGPEQVMGTAGKVKYEYDPEGKPVLIELPLALLIDDKEGKPEGIHLVIGRRPSAAFGNSTGDQQMLEYTQGGEGQHLLMLVHHDDPVREYAYGPDSKVGTFSDALMSEATARGWTVVSMKNDWKRIFSFEK